MSSHREKFRITHVVFDGYIEIPVEWPVPLKINGQFVDCGPDEAVVILCTEDTTTDPCPESCFWNVQHGLTGWMHVHFRPDLFYRGQVYAVSKEWWEGRAK